MYVAITSPYLRDRGVTVIQDASRSISSSAIKWAIGGLSLKPGDELTLLGVLHQVNTPSTFPFMGAGKLSKNFSFFFFIHEKDKESVLKCRGNITFCVCVCLQVTIILFSHSSMLVLFCIFFPPVGYKSRVDSSSMLGANQKIIKDEVTRKELEYQNSTELVKISKLYEMNKVCPS